MLAFSFSETTIFAEKIVPCDVATDFPSSAAIAGHLAAGSLVHCSFSRREKREFIGDQGGRLSEGGHDLIRKGSPEAYVQNVRCQQAYRRSQHNIDSRKRWKSTPPPPRII